MNSALACLVLLTYVCFTRGNDIIKPVQCDEKGTLTASKVDDSPWSIPSTANCENGKNKTTVHIASNSSTITIENCPKNSNVTFQSNRNIDDGITTGSVVRTAEKDTVNITLRCNAIANDVTQDAVITSISYSGATQLESPISQTAIENIKIVMELRNISTDSPTHTMSLNGNYSLLVAGAGSHNIVVKTCTAAGSDNTDGPEIYPSSDSVNVLSDFTKSNGTSKTISGKNVNQIATLTGFRLVGSPTVYLKCSIIVCAGTCTPASEVSSARKRSKHPSSIHYATLKLNVRDNLVNRAPNGAAGAVPTEKHVMKFLFAIMIIKFLY